MIDPNFTAEQGKELDQYIQENAKLRELKAQYDAAMEHVWKLWKIWESE